PIKTRRASSRKADVPSAEKKTRRADASTLAPEKNGDITKWDIFHYVYGILHHPGYRNKVAENLKRELPRIPFAPDFRAFAAAGRELARLHLDYDKLEPYPLKFVETE